MHPYRPPPSTLGRLAAAGPVPALLAVAGRLANRRFAVAVAATALLASKLARLWFHLRAIPSPDVVRWGASFFLQDTLALVGLRALVDGQQRRAANAAAALLVGLVLFLAFVSLTFLAAAGEELQWRNLVLAADSSSWSLAEQALLSGLLVMAGLLGAAAVAQGVCYPVAGTALEILAWPPAAALRAVRRRFGVRYEPVPDADAEAEPGPDGEKAWGPGPQKLSPASRRLRRLRYTAVATALLVQLLATACRPANRTLVYMSWTLPLVYMSWTLPLVPLVDFSQSATALSSLLTSSANVNGTLSNVTALAEPVRFAWLPSGPLPGFEDWYEDGQSHYSAAADPLKISNLDDALLPELRAADLARVPIRHVVLVMLESTRKDVFPLKRAGMPYEKLASLHKDGILPEAGHAFLSNLTGTAKFLTGDHDDGFGANGTAPEAGRSRGGLNANNAFTTSTYTLKSLVGTHCGISPLIANFNVEPSNHVYQPCLPHIFNAFNSLNHTGDAEVAADNFKPFKWNSSFMQSVTTRYDKQDKLMPLLGFPEDKIIDWWSLKGTPKFGVTNITDVNYYGMPEVAVHDYIRDAFVLAKENNERVFLSHLTSTTHHGFGIPEDEHVVSLTDDKEWKDLSNYLNAVGYVDRWLQKILDTLEEQGVANETLLVVTGDHGLSIAERGTITPYNNPHVANYHVPLVFSHPKLPPINIGDAVHSSQILPTILDLLVETGSLSQSETRAASDLVRNYEGQSLLRPQRKLSEKNGMGAWQITAMNPGGATIAVRDARQPTWRLIVPVYGNSEWRFTDLVEDPHELNPISSFELDSLRATLNKNGTGSVKSLWVEEAAEVSRWWFGDNHRRWRCDW